MPHLRTYRKAHPDRQISVGCRGATAAAAADARQQLSMIVPMRIVVANSAQGGVLFSAMLASAGASAQTQNQ